MAGKPATDLSEKQWKAIRMFESGGTRKEIAQAIGVSDRYLQDLILGDVSKAGHIADLFKKEWQKIEEKRDENIKTLIKENTESVQSLLKRVSKELISKKKLTTAERHWLIKANTSLTGNKPSVNIKSLSYSYTQGLNPEELIHEFTRLKSVAESSFNRRRVQTPGETGSGSVPASDEPGS